MNLVKEKDVNLLEAEFFNKPFQLSFSSANVLLDAPVRFYKEYVLKDKDDDIPKYLLEGILIHYLVLDGLDFDSKFIIAPESLPSANNQKVIHQVFKLHEAREDKVDLPLEDYSEEIVNGLKELNLHQSLKTDEQRVAKICDAKGVDYFEFLKVKGRKTIIDGSILDRCSRRAQIILDNKEMCDLIGVSMHHDGKKIGIYNEIELSIENFDEWSFGLKGILDNLVVDVVKKRVIINDFKTTSKKLSQFGESVEHWNYWLQSVIYTHLVKDFLKDVLDDNWQIEFNFIVFDKHDQLYSFPVSGITLQEWKEKAVEVFAEVEYHLTNKEFNLPRAFALRRIKL